MVFISMINPFQRRVYNDKWPSCITPDECNDKRSPILLPSVVYFFASSIADQSHQDYWNEDEEDGKEGEVVQFAKAMNAKGENFTVVNHCLWP